MLWEFIVSNKYKLAKKLYIDSLNKICEWYYYSSSKWEYIYVYDMDITYINNAIKKTKKLIEVYPNDILYILYIRILETELENRK